MKSRLYYEAHVTIDPAQGTDRELVERIARQRGFRLAKRFMMKDSSEHNQDAILTARNVDLKVIEEMTHSCVVHLKREGFKVRRWAVGEPRRRSGTKLFRESVIPQA
jgi:hypothetical protein